MKKKVIVMSLGGSLIIPGDVDYKFLLKFKQLILKQSKHYKFIIVCGGGSIARKYIYAIKEIGLNTDFQSFAGISATRMNARFMSYFFKMDQEMGIPHTLKTVKEYIKQRDVVFCGALEYKPNQTSDSTAVEIARAFNTEFINLTNVQGLHDKNPFEYKNAKFIPRISWADFDKMANKEKFKPGQHFVLDQTASKMIKQHRITTYILGPKMNQLDNLLDNKPFEGTVIQG
jgi:uridylate kinase